jgi:hypothetical protein
MLQSIRCPQCGWQNEPTAIMCGGCGQPLRTMAEMGGAGRDQLAGAASASDLPTLLDVPPPVAPGARSTGAPWPGAQAAAQPRARGRGRFLRGLLALGIALAVLAVIAGGLWSLLIRPALHNQVDTLIGQSFDQAVARVPTFSDEDFRAYGPAFRVSESDINAELQRALPSGSGLDSATVAFRSGALLGTYSAYGTTGTVQTTLQVRGGQLQLAQTQVSGPLGWVETGDELQATLNQGLAQLSSKTPHGFNSVSVGADAITLVLNTAG